jgi:hypothetical protein
MPVVAAENSAGNDEVAAAVPSAPAEVLEVAASAPATLEADPASASDATAEITGSISESLSETAPPRAEEHATVLALQVERLNENSVYQEVMPTILEPVSALGDVPDFP